MWEILLCILSGEWIVRKLQGRKEFCYGQLHNPANAHGHWDGVMAVQMGLRQIWYIYWSQHDLLLDAHLQLFLLLGCDSLWDQMFRIITVICEFLCIHTLLIWQSCYFFSHSPFMCISMIHTLQHVLTSLD